MTVKIIYNENYLPFKNKVVSYIWENIPSVRLETYDDMHFRDKKKAIMIKASCGTKMTPFAAVYNDNKDVIKAFYSETQECTADNIIKYLTDEVRRSNSVG